MIIQKNRGFSLLEILIALMILIILMVMTINIVKSTREYAPSIENEAYMNQVRSALMMFVRVNSFLPCPDSNGDGREDREGLPNVECTTDQGTIPYLDLGVAATDAWGQPLLYAVNARADRNGNLDFAVAQASARYFDNRNAPAFGFDTLPLGRDSNGNDNRGNGNYRICGEVTVLIVPCNANTPNEDMIELSAIAVVVSFGKNGAATWNAFGAGGTGWGAAELENMDNDMHFWKGTGSERKGRAFDDQLFWILGGDVKYAIISSGGQL